MNFLQKNSLTIRVFVTMVLAGALSWGVLAGPAWAFYYNAKDLGPGGVGSPASADTPVARSIAEMQRLDRFMLERYEDPDGKGEGGVHLSDGYYEFFTLDSGEQVAMRYSLDGYRFEPTGNPDGLWYWGSPIGTWRSWGLTEQDQAILAREAPDLATTAFYADMQGSHTDGLLTKDKFVSRWSMLTFPICAAFLVALQILWSRFLRNRTEITRPRNTLERWCVGTYAIWGQFYAGLVYRDPDAAKNRPFYIGAVPRTPDTVREMKATLDSDWDIDSYQDLLDTVAYMSDGPGLWNCRDQAGRAWELCRSMQLLGCAFLIGWCERPELLRRSKEVGRTIQKTFHSWEELCQNFLEGYSRWRLSEGNDTAGMAAVQQRSDIYWAIRRRADSPYQLPWNLDLK